MVIDTDFLKQLESLSLVVRKRITSSFIGERKSEYTGSGLIFTDYASYSYGDDFKNIDWKTYGKTERLFVKRYEEDRNLTIHILIDLSGSMDFGTKIKKYEFASKIALGFAYIAMKNNEKFVLSTFDDKLEFFRPQKGKHQLASILDYLNNKKAVGVSSFASSLLAYKNLIHSKAMVIIISDFFYDTEEIMSILQKYKKNKIKLIQILDPIEKNLNIEGDYNLIDLESEVKIRAYIDAFLKNKYFEKLKSHNALIQDACSHSKANFYSVTSDENVFDIFYRILG